MTVDEIRAVHVPLECVNVRCPMGRWCGGCDPDGDQDCVANPWPCPPLLAVDPTACLDVLPDCPDCVAEALDSRGGRHVCDYLCDLSGRQKRDSAEFHARVHQPTTCRHCSVVLDDHRGTDRIKTRPCPTGTCRVWYCPDCDGEWGSDGPLGCPVCSPVEDAA